MGCCPDLRQKFIQNGEHGLAFFSRSDALIIAPWTMPALPPPGIPTHTMAWRVIMVVELWVRRSVRRKVRSDIDFHPGDGEVGKVKLEQS